MEEFLKQKIRNEKAPDIEAITEVTISAFKDHPISQNTEQFIIHALRAAGALTISLVAEIDGRVVGHIAFSPVTVSDGATGWYGLGPVYPEVVHEGIPQEYFLVLPFTDKVPKGIVTFHEGFRATG